MNLEKVQTLAEQAGDSWDDALLFDKEFLLKFANLVAANEREACAQIADRWPDYDVEGLAVAIRARGVDR